MKQIFLGLSIMVSVAAYSQQKSSNPFQQSENANNAQQQSDEANKSFPSGAGDPVPINQYIPYLLAAGVALVFVVSKKMRTAK